MFVFISEMCGENPWISFRRQIWTLFCCRVNTEASLCMGLPLQPNKEKKWTLHKCSEWWIITQKLLVNFVRNTQKSTTAKNTAAYFRTSSSSWLIIYRGFRWLIYYIVQNKTEWPAKPSWACLWSLIRGIDGWAIGATGRTQKSSGCY